jgi:hypothetical protein
MWLLLLGVWKCGQSNRPHRTGPDVDRVPGHSRCYPQFRPCLESVSGSERRNSDCFPRFHSNPQLSAGKIDMVVHSNPQCGKRADGCGRRGRLSTAASRRELTHKLSRGVIHLSTGYPQSCGKRPQPFLRGASRGKSDIIRGPGGRTTTGSTLGIVWLERSEEARQFADRRRCGLLIGKEPGA